MDESIVAEVDLIARAQGAALSLLAAELNSQNGSRNKSPNPLRSHSTKQSIARLCLLTNTLKYEIYRCRLEQQCNARTSFLFIVKTNPLMSGVSHLMEVDAVRAGTRIVVARVILLASAVFVVVAVVAGVFQEHQLPAVLSIWLPMAVAIFLTTPRQRS